MSSDTITIDDVRQAAARIAPHAHRTPVLTSATLDRLSGLQLFFKCENFQRVGAFKFRGACNAVFALDEATARRGVATHSSGNHAQAVALAARLRGIPAHIVMPRSVSAVKLRAVEEYGGRVTLCEPTQDSRESTARRIVEETGVTLVHPYDDPFVIAGQGTAVLELLDEVPDLDAIIAPVGGGGMLSGTCVTASAVAPALRVFAAEPSGADDAARSFAAGERIPLTNHSTIADGLLTSLGDLTWPILRRKVEQVFTVDDDQIVAALRLVWERMKILIEPSSAVPVAVVLADELRTVGVARVGVILTGGNVELDRLPW